MNVIALLPLAITFGALPLVLYTLILWWFDRYEREPWPLLIAAFVWGFIPAALLSIVMGLLLNIPLAWLLGSDGLAYSVASTGFAAPLVEEATKAAGLGALWYFLRGELDSLFDGLLYGAVIGFGFGAVENILYLASSQDVSSLLVLAGVRSVLFGLNHAMYTGLMGLAVGAAALVRARWARPFLLALGFGAAVLAHAGHNTGLTLIEVSPLGLGMTLVFDAFGVLFLLGVIVSSWVREGRIVARFLEDEIDRGTLRREDLAKVSSFFRRGPSRWQPLLAGDVSGWRRQGRFRQACAELAFLKRRSAREGREMADTLEELRHKVIALRPTS